MVIYNSIGEQVIEIEVDSNSYSHEAVMSENVLLLNFSVPVYTEIPLYSYCDFYGTRYTLAKPENLTRHGKRNLEVSLKLEGPPFHLAKYKVRNIVDKRLKFSLTAKPVEFLQLFVDNLNLRDSGWTVGTCIDAAEKTLTFNHTYVDAALKNAAEEFKTEYEIVGKAINLWKVEYNKDAPLALSYGKGNGFLPDCGRFNFENNVPIEVLFVEGGEKNIDGSKYGSKQLLLPKSQSLVYEGRIYVTDAEGLSVSRGDKALSTHQEDSLDCTHIYPSRVGTVSAVEEANSFYDIIDTSIPEALDFSLCGIAGEKATIIFQTGMLAGREFDIEADSNGNLTGYVHEERRFKIVSQEFDGETMPSAVFTPAVGDKYAMFGIQLPDAYVCDNVSKTGASWDMLREAAKHLYENEDPRFSFTGELDGVWSKKYWLTVGGKIKLGGYTSFTDVEFQTTPALVRIVDIVRYVNDPKAPKIKLSNVTVGGNVRSDLRKIEENEFVVTEKHKDSITYTKRRFRDAQETISMLESALLDFDGKIKPVAIQTLSLLVGDESLQFKFVDSKATPAEVTPALEYDEGTKKFTASAGIIQHMTLGISSSAPSHPVEDYKFWDIAAYESPALEVKTEKFYLYARVDAEGTTGTFLLSKTAITLNGEAGYYHLLIGFLNSEYDGERGFTTLYGFTEILPGRITTDRLQDKNAKLVIDLANAIIEAKNGAEIKGKLTIGSGSSGLDKFSEYEALVDSIELARLFIQYSVDGSTLWHETFTSGDLYMRQKNGITGEWSAAIRIVGIPGNNGNPGSYYELQYAIGTTSVPTTGWQATAPTPTTGNPYVWMRTHLVTPPSTYGEWTYTKLSGLNGATGIDGKSIEFIFTRTTTATAPETPEGENTDDFVPTGWTDDQLGVTSTYKYEWSSKRTKVAGVWGVYSTPALWARYSSDGLPGSDADAQAAKDDIAKALGYVSWDAMHHAITTGKTIIDGGHLRTELIEAYSILTSNLSTATSGQRITISKELNAIIMYDASGNIRARLGGDALGSVGTSGSTFACSSNGGSIQKYTSGWTSGVYTIGGSNLLATIQPAESNNSVHIPAIYFDIDITDIAGFSSEDEASVTCKLYMGSSLIKSVNYNSNLDGWIHQIVIPALDTELAAISNELRVEFEYSFYVAPGYEGFSALLALTFAASTGSINYPYELTEFAGNGFRSMWASDMYFLVQYLAGACKIEQRVGNYGFRVSASGFEKTTNGGATWVAASL